MFLKQQKVRPPAVFVESILDVKEDAGKLSGGEQ